jgi:hypothetical protein
VAVEIRQAIDAVAQKTAVQRRPGGLRQHLVRRA